MVVDHEDDSQISYLFQKIETEQNGRLDILVNNAYKAVHVKIFALFNNLTFTKVIFFITLKTIFDNSGVKFWESKPV